MVKKLIILTAFGLLLSNCNPSPQRCNLDNMWWNDWWEYCVSRPHLWR